MSAQRVLCLVPQGVEELELIAPVDLLRRAGVEVVLAAIGDDRRIRGRNGIVLEADMRADDLPADPWNGMDALLLPGGPGVQTLLADGRAARWTARFLAAGRDVAAICAAPLVLKEAGCLEGRRFTAHRSVWDQWEGRVFPDDAVVEDGPVITSAGAGTAIGFGLVLVRRWAGAEAARAVAEAIHARP